MHVSRLAGALALACLAAAAPTLAHAAEVDLTPIASYGIEILLGVLATAAVSAAGVLAALIKKKTGIDLAILQTRDNATLHAGIARVVDAIEASARERLFGPDGRITVDVADPMVAEAANKLAARSPDLLKRIGVDETTLRELVAERINSSGYFYGSLVAAEAISAPAPAEKPLPDPEEQTERLTRTVRAAPPLQADVAAGLPGV